MFSRVALDKHRRRYLACTFFEGTDQASRQLYIILEKALPEVLEFRFHNLDSKGSRTDGCAFGSNAAYLEFRREHKIISWDPIYDIPRIVLHSQYLFSLKYLSAYGSKAELENIHLRIAITVCHELAHIVWKYRANKQVSPW